MALSFLGYDEKVVTFKADESLEAGALVKISANETVAAANEGEIICGKVVNVRNGYAAVQLAGYMEATYTGDVNLGNIRLVADANGGVKNVEADGKEVLAINIDSNNSKIAFIL